MSNKSTSSLNLSSIIKDNLIVIVGVLLLNLKAIILIPIIIKHTGTGMYGAYVLFNSLVGIIYAISSLGVGITKNRFLPGSETRKEKSELFYPQFFFTIITTLCFSLILILTSDIIREFIFKNGYEFSSLLFLAYLISYFFYAQGQDFFRYTSRIRLMTLGSVVFPYLSILFILTSINYIGFIDINILVLSESLAAIIIGVFFFQKILKEIGFKFSFFRLHKLKKEIILGFPLTINMIVDFILSSSDRYFIAYFISVNAVAYYNAPYILGTIILIIPRALGMVIPHLMFKYFDKGDELAAKNINKYTIKIFFIFAIPFIFGCFLISDLIIELLANEEVALNSYYVTPLIAIASVFSGLTYILSNVMFLQLNTRLILKANLIASILNIILNIILLKIFGNILVAAITTILSYAIAFVYIQKQIEEEWRVSLNIGFISKVLLSSFVMYLILEILIYFLDSFSNSIQIISILIVSVPIYISLCVLFGVFSKEEKNFIQSSFRSFDPF